MLRFLFWFALFIFVAGTILHYKVDIPYFLSWIGKLPGDMIIKNNNAILYFPITSSATLSLILIILLTLFSKKK